MFDTIHLVATAAKAAADDDWLSRHTTLVISVTSVVFSAFVGPTVTGLLTNGRERQKDHRTSVAARRDDLRSVLDDAANVLSGAVGKLRPLLEAEQAGDALPAEPAEFVRSLVPLGERLRLRVPDHHAIATTYESAQEALDSMQTATASQQAWDTAAENFEARRSEFLAAGREALHKDIKKDTEI